MVYIGPNHYDRNKNGIPIGLSLAPSNIHDVNLVENTIDNIAIKIVGSRIGADKGYISFSLKEKLKKIKILIL
jgi:transposase